MDPPIEGQLLRLCSYVFFSAMVLTVKFLTELIGYLLIVFCTTMFSLYGCVSINSLLVHSGVLQGSVLGPLLFVIFNMKAFISRENGYAICYYDFQTMGAKNFAIFVHNFWFS